MSKKRKLKEMQKEINGNAEIKRKSIEFEKFLCEFLFNVERMMHKFLGI